jgi:HEAT repeat protein
MAHGKPVAHWVQALQDPSATVRKKAVNVLGNVGAVDPAVVPALARALKDRDVGVRRAAVLALLKIGPAARDVVPALKELGKP